MTGASGSGCSTNPMDIVFGNVRQVKIHNPWEGRDVDSPSCNVGCNQYVDSPFLKPKQRLGACVLALVAVNGFCLNTRFHQEFDELVSTVLGTTKDKRLMPLLRAN